MTGRHVQILAAVVFGLVALLFVMQTADHGGDATGGGRLLPDLALAADGLTEVVVDGPASDDTVTLDKADGAWTVAERDAYPADLGKLRQLVLALSEADVVERKTADPDNYARLGVAEPGSDGAGTKVSLTGATDSFAVILGDVARGESRYARIADQPQSVLIDRNPDLPTDAADWLLPDIADIPGDEIRKVTIIHADGETIVIEKLVGAPLQSASEVSPEEASEADAAAERPTNFTVLDIPEGRELSHDGVANGIGGALANLRLDDVRRATAGEVETTAVFETFDDQKITVTVTGGDDAGWVAFAADPDIDGLNARTAGWQYRMPDFKKNLLVRRWDDLLTPKDM